LMDNAFNLLDCHEIYVFILCKRYILFSNIVELLGISGIL
jgi:hypothetical protein